MAIVNPPSSTALRITACVGLVLFGAVVGIVAALSEASGTATTLLGLLFALIGGSLVSLFAKDKLTERDRDNLASAVGLISLGILLGLAAGFGLKKSEKGASTVTTPGSDGAGRPVFVIHSHAQDKVTSLKNACKSVADKMPKEDPNYTKFDELCSYLTFLESVEARLNGIDAVLKETGEKYNKDAFVSKFREFRKPDPPPKG